MLNPLSDRARSVLLDIAQCDNYLNSSCHDCEIISNSASNDKQYLPIPWQGHIEVARILFVSSNPSVLGNQKRSEIAYGPTKSWLDGDSNDEKIVDFFESRFDTRPLDSMSYSRKGIYYLCNQQPPHAFSTQWVRYWASIRKRAAELLNKSHNEIEPGLDYAITEIVHCQSNKEEGVAEARSTCINRFFNQVIGLAQNASIIVILGSHALKLINKKYNFSLKEYDWKKESLCGQERIILSLPHPNSRGKRKALTPSELENLHSANKMK